MYGWDGMGTYLPVTFQVVCPTFLVNSPVIRNFKVDDQYEQKWLFKWARNLGYDNRTLVVVMSGYLRIIPSPGF